MPPPQARQQHAEARVAGVERLLRVDDLDRDDQVKSISASACAREQDAQHGVAADEAEALAAAAPSTGSALRCGAAGPGRSASGRRRAANEAASISERRSRAPASATSTPPSSRAGDRGDAEGDVHQRVAVAQQPLGPSVAAIAPRVSAARGQGERAVDQREREDRREREVRSPAAASAAKHDRLEA